MSKERESNVATLLEFLRTFMFRNLYSGISLIFFFKVPPGAIELLGRWFSITKVIPDKQKCITLWQGIISNFPLNWNSHFSCQKYFFLVRKFTCKNKLRSEGYSPSSASKGIGFLERKLYASLLLECFPGISPDTLTTLLTHKCHKQRK